ncbi:hypothetical protein KJ766_03005 [Patescibacteria group bacterium]|nr:hypothetical protein [Patescibacteria group bacterium]
MERCRPEQELLLSELMDELYPEYSKRYPDNPDAAAKATAAAIDSILSNLDSRGSTPMSEDAD